MIYCVIGTRAQLIKMAPVIKLLEERELSTTMLMTGQHKETMEEIYNDFGLSTTRRHLYSGPEITGIGQTVVWMAGQLWHYLRLRKALRRARKGGSRDIVLVHGDTLSTLLGALAGKLWGLPVGHVEAGLRSFRLLDPFPEEIVRRIVTRLSSVAYCPGEWAFNNLASARNIERIDVGQNTLVDSLRMALASQSRRDDAGEKYVIVSTHRFENIFNDSRLASIVSIVKSVADRAKVIFVLHPATRKQLARKGHMQTLQSCPNVELVPRMSYSRFIDLLSRACCVLTDGGGNQEEMAYLGKPAFLLRSVTERKEGLGKNVVLTNFDQGLILSGIEASLKAVSTGTVPDIGKSPSELIATHLAAYGN